MEHHHPKSLNHNLGATTFLYALKDVAVVKDLVLWSGRLKFSRKNKKKKEIFALLKDVLACSLLVPIIITKTLCVQFGTCLGVQKTHARVVKVGDQIHHQAVVRRTCTS